MIIAIASDHGGFALKEKIKEFQKFIWDSRADMDDQEMKSMMGASELEITLAQNKSNHFKNLIRLFYY